MRQPIPFGKYVLLERISVGGMAEVFKSKAFGVEGFEKILAIKRIPVSIAFPSVALSYVLVAVAAHFLWGEALGWPGLWLPKLSNSTRYGRCSQPHPLGVMPRPCR